MCSLKINPMLALIANCTSPENREYLIAELGEPRDGFFKPLKASFTSVTGETIVVLIFALDIMPNDILSPSGMAKAKQCMLAVLEYIAKKNISVVAFTASTKRLPGKSGQEVKNMYPNTIFTIGDNGTLYSLLQSVNHCLKFIDKKANIACLGAGFLGEPVIRHLITEGCSNVSVITQQYLPEFDGKVKIFKSIDEMPGDIKLFLSCSHKYVINPKIFKNLISENGVILDVAVPPGINLEVFSALPKSVQRYDAGDYYLDDIHIKFPVKILNFPNPRFWFGCWTETIMIALAKLAGENLDQYDFFNINAANQELIIRYIKQEKISIPMINFFDVKELLIFPVES